MRTPRHRYGWVRRAARPLEQFWTRLAAHNVSLAAAGVAFWTMLATFPALAALVSIYGLYADPMLAFQQFKLIRRIMPDDAWALLNNELQSLVRQDQATLTFGALVGFGVSLWSAGSGVRALIAGLNVIYGTREHRGLLRVAMTATGLTLGVLCLITVALSLIAVAPIALRLIYLDSITEMFVSSLRWALLLCVVVVGLLTLYRFGGSHAPRSWRSIAYGAATATVLWLIVSALFSFYVASFGTYNATYGTLGAVVVLLMWFYASSYLVLLGAEVTASCDGRGIVPESLLEAASREIVHAD